MDGYYYDNPHKDPNRDKTNDDLMSMKSSHGASPTNKASLQALALKKGASRKKSTKAKKRGTSANRDLIVDEI
jgi:hypothetical protein